MIRRILISIAALLAAGPLLAADAEQALRDFLESTDSIQASFTQVIYAPDEEIIEESNGMLSISRPDRFRWDYDDPEQLIIADGKKLWLFDIELDQISVADQAESMVGSPAALLGGGARALDDFVIDGQFRADDIAWLRLRPRQPQSDFETISVAFHGGQLHAMELNDALGQRTRVLFDDMTTNTTLEDSLFVMQVPEGVDVIDNSVVGDAEKIAVRNADE